MSKLRELIDNHASPEVIAETAAENGDLLVELLEGVSPDNKSSRSRQECHQVLAALSDRRPDILYERWDYFADLLRSDNPLARVNAVYLLAALARVDDENRFEELFRSYFDLLDDESSMVAAHVAARAGRVAKARPDLRDWVTGELLSVDLTHHLPERKDQIRAYAIQSLGEYYEAAQNKTDILEFVRSHRYSDGPRTRKAAQEFLGRARAEG